MFRSFRSPCLRIILAIALATLIIAPARAQQSDSDLRKQNLELNKRVQDLEQDLRQALDRNKQLQDRIAQLERDLATARQNAPATSPSAPPATTPEQITVDESKANASPRALFKALEASNQKAMAGMDIGSPGDRNRRAYLRKLESWRNSVNREFRSPIKWYVRVIDFRIDQNGQRIATLAAVDPVTDARLGNTFDVILTQNFVERLSSYESHGELGVLILRGTLLPDVQINENREERGSFDNPPFIGPFAELGFHVDVASIILPREETKEPTPPAATRPAVPGKTAPPPQPVPVEPEKP